MAILTLEEQAIKRWSTLLNNITGNDAAGNASETTLTISGSLATSGEGGAQRSMIGRKVTVTGAGTGGSLYEGTITNIVSIGGNQVVVTPAFGTSVTNATYTIERKMTALACQNPGQAGAGNEIAVPYEEGTVYFSHTTGGSNANIYPIPAITPAQETYGATLNPVTEAQPPAGSRWWVIDKPHLYVQKTGTHIGKILIRSDTETSWLIGAFHTKG